MIPALTFAIYAVTLNGETVLPRARAGVAGGHVLLPVRALGNALGADVGYDGRTHTITVQRGAHVATIPARGAVRVAGGRAYAPLRAVASAFGLGVGYDARTRTVALSEAATALPLARATQLPAAAPAPARAPSYTIVETPRSGAEIHEAYPTISARFAGAASIDPRSLRVVVDGRDVTADASVIGDQVVVTPRAALAPGNHDVEITARDAHNGAALGRAWSFTDTFAFIAAPAPTPFPISAIWIDRWIVPGTNAFDVYVEGAPGVTGYVGVDGVGGFFPLRVYSANGYVAHVVVPNGVNQPFARVAARLTLPSGQVQTIVLPQRINLVTPPIVPLPLAPPATPAPAPTPVPRPLPTRRSVDVPTPTPAPVPPRRSVLTATPAPAPSPAPAATPRATPLPTASPAASAAPSPQRTRRPLIRRSPSPSPAAAPAPQ